MNKDSRNNNGNSRFWNFIDNIQGDKVVWVIVFMLIIVSVLAIFSSTSLLKEGTKDRIDFIRDHIIVVGIGLGLITGLYNIKRIGVFRFFAKLGFLVSLAFLAMLDSHLKIPGVIEAEYINGAWRTLRVAVKPLRPSRFYQALRLHRLLRNRALIFRVRMFRVHSFRE